jgi:hypothetical protein
MSLFTVDIYGRKTVPGKVAKKYPVFPPSPVCYVEM